MRSEEYFYRVKRGLWVLMKNVNPQFKGLVKHMIDNVDDGIEEHRAEVYDAKSIGVRNPAFEGDMVGWLNDDFEDSDDEDENDDDKKRKPK